MSYQRQTAAKPLFDDLLWSKPQQKALAGKLLIVGGNAHAIAAPSEAFAIALKQGIGEVRAVMPDKTRKLLGPKIPIDIELVASTPSGSFSTKAEQPLKSYVAWADATLFAGDIGRNSETAIVLETLASKMPRLQIYTRDAVDYFYTSPETLFDRPETLIVLSLAQLQKCCQQLGSTIPVTFDMGIEQLCELLQTVTTVHKAHIVVQYFANIITAVEGGVVITKLDSEPHSWRLKVATAASVWWLQNQNRPLEAIATAVTQVTL